MKRSYRDLQLHALFSPFIVSRFQLETIGAGTGRGSFDFAQFYSDSARRTLVDEALAEPGMCSPGDVPEMELLSLYATSDLTQMKACIKKAAISYWRSPSYNVTRMLISAGVAFLFGSVFWQQE